MPVRVVYTRRHLRNVAIDLGFIKGASPVRESHGRRCWAAPTLAAFVRQLRSLGHVDRFAPGFAVRLQRLAFPPGIRKRETEESHHRLSAKRHPDLRPSARS